MFSIYLLNINICDKKQEEKEKTQKVFNFME
jgi:hypothetical protein